MNTPTAKERMTREKLNAKIQTWSDPDGGSVEIVLLADALAYGASEREAGIMEAARAQCSGCAGKWEGYDSEVILSGSQRYWHRGPKRDEHCLASHIHDALAMRAKEGDAGDG